MTYSFYQSVKTIPTELTEAAAIFRFGPWLRFKTLELPFAALGLIWNSMMSWAGGWFFLMAAEIFTIGSRDFRLPGIGAYLQTAASSGDLRAVAAGVIALILTIVAAGPVDLAPDSGLGRQVQARDGRRRTTVAILVARSPERVRGWSPGSKRLPCNRCGQWIDRIIGRHFQASEPELPEQPDPTTPLGVKVFAAITGAGLLYRNLPVRS